MRAILVRRDVDAAFGLGAGERHAERDRLALAGMKVDETLYT